MKTLFFVMFLMNSLIGFCQYVFPIDTKSNDVLYTETITMDSTVTASKMYSVALEWVALNYKSANDVIQHTDNVNNTIIVKGNFKPITYIMNDWVIEHTLKFRFTDGKWKYEIFNTLFLKDVIKYQKNELSLQHGKYRRLDGTN